MLIGGAVDLLAASLLAEASHRDSRRHAFPLAQRQTLDGEVDRVDREREDAQALPGLGAPTHRTRRRRARVAPATPYGAGSRHFPRRAARPPRPVGAGARA